MYDTPSPAVENTGLHKTFGNVVAVDGLDIRVEAGSFFGFLGPNGAGKSTTIKILTGMILPTSGNAAILGHDVVDDAVAAKQITGAVSEDGALFERLTGAEYLEFIGRASRSF
jgi:ABC-2 type transport system ATP-binding protein